MVGSTEKIKRVGIPINLQFFADGGTGDTGSKETDDDDKLDESELNLGGDSWKPCATKEEESALLAKISMKQRAKTERSKLRILGVDSFDTAKKIITEHAEMSKKLEELNKINTELTGKLTEIETDSKLLAVGVDSSKLTKVKALLSTYKAENIEDSIKLFSEDEDNSVFFVTKKSENNNGKTKPIVSPKETNSGSTNDKDPLSAYHEYAKKYGIAKN